MAASTRCRACTALIRAAGPSLAEPRHHARSLVSRADAVSEETVKNLLTTSPAEHPVTRVSTPQVQRWTTPNGPARRTVAVLDFGVKRSFIDRLLKAGCDVIQAPYDTDADTIISWSPDGVFLSNGPGDPRQLEVVLPTVRAPGGAISRVWCRSGTSAPGLGQRRTSPENAFGASRHQLSGRRGRDPKRLDHVRAPWV